MKPITHAMKELGITSLYTLERLCRKNNVEIVKTGINRRSIKDEDIEKLRPQIEHKKVTTKEITLDELDKRIELANWLKRKGLPLSYLKD